MRIVHIAGHALREAAARRYLLLAPGLLILILAMAAAMMAESGMASARTDPRLLEQIQLMAIGTTGFFSILTAILLGGSLLRYESDRGTLDGILSKPVSRADYVLGRFSGLCCVIALLWLPCVLFQAGVTIAFQPHASWPDGFQIVPAVLLSLLLAAGASMVSAVAPSSTASFCALLAYLVSVPLGKSDMTHSWAETLRTSLVWILPRWELFYELRGTRDWTLLGWTTLHTAGYICLFLTVGWILFSIRDVQRTGVS